MDVSLSDLVTCPRCGPTYGLVLLPHAVADRRVSEGVLGCANCRERYPIAGGVADLRPGGGAGETPAGSGAGDRESAIRLAALMGLAEVRGPVLLAGPASAHAAAVAELLDGVEVAAIGPGTGWGAGVSAFRAEGVIPFRTGSMEGAALTGEWAARLEEGGRVLRPGARLVLDPVPADGPARIEAAGLEVAAREGGVVVAVRPA